MTDNEIIKALECCSTGKSCYDVCPFDDKFGITSCTKKLSNAALDLINRQKDKIKEFDEKLIIQQGLIDYQKAEIEKLKQENEFFRKTITENAQRALEVTVEEIETAKSEAIKEFEEELECFVLNEDIEVVEPKCKDYESYINGANQFRHQIKNGINNILKEMTEVNEK